MALTLVKPAKIWVKLIEPAQLPSVRAAPADFRFMMFGQPLDPYDMTAHGWYCQRLRGDATLPPRMVPTWLSRRDSLSVLIVRI